MNKTTKTQVQQFVRKEKNLLERKSREYISIQVPEGIYICIYIKKFAHACTYRHENI